MLVRPVMAPHTPAASSGEHEEAVRAGLGQQQNSATVLQTFLAYHLADAAEEMALATPTAMPRPSQPFRRASGWAG